MYLLAPFILQNFQKNSQSQSRVMRMCHFQAQNSLICPEQNFWYKPLLLSSTYWPFSLCKIKKKFLQRIQSNEDASFLGSKWSTCPKQKFFLKKITNIIFIYLLTPFILQNFKKNSYSQSRVIRMCHFSGPKQPNLS